MPFPTTPILDDFNNGANQGLSTRAGWSASHVTYVDFVTDAVPTKAVAAGNADNIWGSNFVDCEVYTTIQDWPSLSGSFRVVGRWAASGNYYMCQIYATGWNVQRWDANVATVNIASGSFSPVAGDSLGLSCVGSTISGYYRSGAGAWTLLGSGTDSLYGAAGGIGPFTESGAGNSIDSFGGGGIFVPGAPARDTHTAIPFTRGAGGGGKI